MLGGFLVWAAHFFVLYGFASLFPGTAIARWLTILATIVALAATAWGLRRSLTARQSADGLGSWMDGIAAAGHGTAFIAILYQGLPALVV